MFRRGCIYVLSAVTLLVGCTAHDDFPSGSSSVTFSVALEGGTKASGTAAGENGVSTLDVLVFRSDGSYVNSCHSASSSVSLTLEKGNLICYAVVNATQDLGSVTSPSALEGKLSRLDANSPGRMEMVGKKTVNITGDTESVVMDVNRTMAKVVLKGINVAFASDAYRSSSLVVNSIYLLNVNPYQAYSLSPSAAAASEWFNQMKRVSGSADALISESYSKTLVDGGSDAVEHYFYAAPNPTDSDAPGVEPFSARRTRLVIEATLDGETCYYPITLPAMECNHSYEIQGLTITGSGSSNPDIPQGRVLVDFTVVVNPWGSLTHDVPIS